MPQFIEPVVKKVIEVLQARTPNLLGTRPPFVDFGKTFTGVVPNFPSVYVMPVRTAFDRESQHILRELHQITVKMALAGDDPQALADDAMAYMKAVDQALAASWPDDWQTALASGEIADLFIAGHDYGPLFERERGLARFPELELLVETQEM